MKAKRLIDFHKDLNWLLQYDQLIMWKENEDFCVKFMHSRAKGKYFYYNAMYGRGDSVQAACRNYRKQLTGLWLEIDHTSYKETIKLK